MVGIVAYPIVAQAGEVNCTFPQEDPSNKKKIVTLNSMGIKISIPSNYRSMARGDGSIDLVDNGTFQMFDCLVNNPEGVGGRGYNSINIYKSKAKKLFSNSESFEVVPNQPNMRVIWQQHGEEHDLSYSVKLRIKTKKGLIEVEQTLFEVLIGTDGVKNKIDEMIEIASLIDIL
ncbi:hypothetical protein [Nostoc sp. UHCC 0251]|uniref:hypothetical protein n=1 Tax=Nostoc sp. UHCC 0251 TaxID=3110240 RepID=UPI002B204014|nr:hypothetical protein [Nostoc sp. UHCC 0251]MEA5625295.1 hypothetical protein [Nostoc sp. UHCC 0251]